MSAMTRVLGIGGIGLLGAIVGYFGSNTIANLGAQTKHYGIQLVPQGNGELKVDNNNQCANDRNPHEGCLLFETNKVGQIKFYLPGSKFEMKKCAGTEKTANNVITKVELTTAGENGNSDDVKGNYTTAFPLDDWIKYDAFPAVNLNNGVVFEAPVDKAASQVFMENLNSHKASDGIKSFWYRITVTACDDPDGDNVHETWVSDPRGDNRGLK